MRMWKTEDWRRRDFPTRSTFAGVAGLLGVAPGPVAAEPAPETSRMRLVVVSGSTPYAWRSSTASS